MKSSMILAALLMSIGFAQIVAAQEMPEPATPTDQHKWLKKFAGQWEMANKGIMGEGQLPIESTGTMKSEMLGGFWVVNVMNGDVAGMKFRGIQTIGYDTKKKKYVGTWVDSLNNYMWHYEGNVDESGKKIVLEAKGPNMMNTGQMNLYRDAYEFKNDDLIVVTSSMQREDGKWITFMKGKTTRTKTAEK